MLKKRFLLSWFLSTIVMMGMSLFWHGIVLTDLRYIPSPESLFYALFVLVYILIGFSLTFLYTYLSMGIGLKLKSSLMGIAFGFFIYLIAFVLGISFKGTGAAHVVVDFIWQMIEQGVGGSVVGLIYMLARRYDKSMKSNIV